MRNINKILAIVLTLAIIAGSLVAAVPVAADASRFSDVNSPLASTMPGNFLVTGGNVTMFAQSQDGKAQFAYDNGTSKKLYASVDGGMSWSAPAATGVASANVTAIAVSTNYASDSTVVVAEGFNIWRSTNGGSSFAKLTGTATPAIAKPIKSLAYGLNYDGSNNICLIGTVDGTVGDAAVGNLYVWTSDTLYTNVTGAGYVAGDVIGVGFSPNYAIDYQIFAVTVSDAGSYPVTFETSPANTFAWVTKTSTTAVSATKASIAVPTDYDSINNNVILVGLNPGGIYKVDFAAVPITDNRIYDGAVTSLALNSSTVYAGLATGDVRRSTNAFTSSSGVTWTAATKKPFPNTAAGAALVAIASNGNIIAVTAGTTGGAYISTDAGVTFNGAGLISASAGLTYNDLAVIDNTTMFILAKDGAHYLLFTTSDAGTTWSLVYNYVQTGAEIFLSVNSSPAFATDKTLFLPMSNKKVQKSTDGGLNFTTITAAGPFAGTPVMTAFLVKDGSTFYAAYSPDKTVYKSGRNTASLAITTGTRINTLAMDKEGNVYIGDDAGYVWKSTDDALNFAKVIDKKAGTTVNVIGFDPKNSNNIMVGANNGVYFVDYTTPEWKQIKSTTGAVRAMVVTADGALYANDTANGYVRSLNPALNDSIWSVDDRGATGLVTGLNVIGLNFYVIKAGASVRILTDLNKNPVATSFPVAGGNVPTNNIYFTWVTYPSGVFNLVYDIQVSRDSGFVSNIIDSVSTPTVLTGPVLGTMYVYTSAVSAFVPGQTYYYRVRLGSDGATKRLLSPWSPVVQFTVALPADVNQGINAEGRISPTNGKTDVSVTTPLLWGAVDGATSYELQLADNATFANAEVATGLTSTVYTPKAALKAGTTYFWKVRAVSATGNSAWVASAFITAAAAPTVTAAPTQVAPVITVNVPTQAPITVTQIPAPVTPPVTPAYIWFIIVIGAVLVIAVIVLIVRTRRV